MDYAIGFLIGVISTLTFFYIWGSKRIKRNSQVKEVMDIYSKLQKQSKTKQMVKDNAARVASMEKAIKLLKGHDDTKN
jgi:H+/gluconate symporter-like permease